MHRLDNVLSVDKEEAYKSQSSLRAAEYGLFLDEYELIYPFAEHLLSDSEACIMSEGK
jgi:hypothetical protein